MRERKKKVKNKNWKKIFLEIDRILIAMQKENEKMQRLGKETKCKFESEIEIRQITRKRESKRERSGIEIECKLENDCSSFPFDICSIRNCKQ